MNIGDRIRERRIELGWSQRELAEKMGYNHSTVGRIETGKIDIPQSKIVRFGEVLGVSVRYLIGEDMSTNTLGEKIRAARLKKGLTQDKLGQLLGVEKSAVAKYENGRIVNLKQATLKKVSSILEIPISELIPIMGQDESSILNHSVSVSRSVFCKNLRILIAKNGKSRQDISEAIGVSYSTFSDWYNGKKYPRIEKLEKLAKYLGVTVPELVGEQQEVFTKNESNQISKDEILDIILRLHTDAEFLRIVEKISALDNEKRKALEQFLNVFDKY